MNVKRKVSEQAVEGAQQRRKRCWEETGKKKKKRKKKKKKRRNGKQFFSPFACQTNQICRRVADFAAAAVVRRKKQRLGRERRVRVIIWKRPGEARGGGQLGQ